MKRSILCNIKVIPATDGKLIDRQGFLSAVLGAEVTAINGNPESVSLNVEVLTGDSADGTDLALTTDPLVIMGDAGDIYGLGLYNVDIDLVGCKRYVKLVPTPVFSGGTTPGISADYAVALGDNNIQPV